SLAGSGRASRPRAAAPRAAHPNYVGMISIRRATYPRAAEIAPARPLARPDLYRDSRPPRMECCALRAARASWRGWSEYGTAPFSARSGLRSGQALAVRPARSPAQPPRLQRGWARTAWPGEAASHGSDRSASRMPARRPSAAPRSGSVRRLARSIQPRRLLVGSISYRQLLDPFLALCAMLGSIGKYRLSTGFRTCSRVAAVYRS